MSIVQAKPATRPALPLPVQAAGTSLALGSPSSTRATRSTGTTSTDSDDDTLSSTSRAPYVPRWVHRLDVVGPSYRRHAPALVNVFHPAQAYDAQQPYQPRDADLLRCTWAAVGTQVGFAYLGTQLAVDMLFPQGPSPFNPTGHRAMIAGLVLLGISVPGLVCSGSGLANVLVGVAHAACRHDRDIVRLHPRAAAVGSYGLATTAAVAGVVGSALWIHALSQQSRRGEINDATWADLTALPLLTTTLSLSLLPVVAWYAGQGLGAVAGTAPGAVGRRWGKSPGPIALD